MVTGTETSVLRSPPPPGPTNQLPNWRNKASHPRTTHSLLSTMILTKLMVSNLDLPSLISHGNMLLDQTTLMLHRQTIHMLLYQISRMLLHQTCLMIPRQTCPMFPFQMIMNTTEVVLLPRDLFQSIKLKRNISLLHR